MFKKTFTHKSQRFFPDLNHQLVRWCKIWKIIKNQVNKYQNKQNGKIKIQEILTHTVNIMDLIL